MNTNKTTATLPFPRILESSVFRILLTTILLPIFLTSCNEFKTKKYKSILECRSYKRAPVPYNGKPINFLFLLEQKKERALFVDFVDQGINGEFHSLEVIALKPNEWKGYKFSIYYQSKPLINERLLKAGDNFEYTCTVTKDYW